MGTYPKKLHNSLWAGLTVALVSTHSISSANCQTSRPATASDMAGGQGEALLKAMTAACKAQDSAKFFSLQTDDANKLLASNSPAEKKKKLFSQYCTFTDGALNGLGGNVSAATHSIGPYKNKTKCGVLSSYWFVNNKAGDLVLRLEVAVESGRLKIDTH